MDHTTVQLFLTAVAAIAAAIAAAFAHLDRKKTEKVDEGVERIHVLVNSQKEKLEREAVSLNAEVLELNAEVLALKTELASLKERLKAQQAEKGT